ncbi:MAG: Cof-type HAD-IIB family hydrolase, partial [Clostridia bacterium]|nr:Cof-type HAD-IIB family hydrolase [Clostridia bacterium]
MNYRLIAADIDGTLLTSSRQLTDRTREAILAAREKGVLFTLSTGRPIVGIRPFLDLLSEDVPVITYNGAMVIRSGSEEILFSQNLDDKVVSKIFRLGLKRGATVVAWAQNRLYCTRIDQRLLDYRSITMETPHLVSSPLEIPRPVTKMLWLDDAEKNRQNMDYLRGRLPNVHYITSSPVLLEFMNAAVSKSAALRSLASSLGIPMEQVIAVGDGLND